MSPWSLIGAAGWAPSPAVGRTPPGSSEGVAVGKFRVFVARWGQAGRSPVSESFRLRLVGPEALQEDFLTDCKY